jgi:hypothetical protein
MGWLHTSRGSGEHRYTNAKVAIFCVGAGIACVGIATDERWIITVAIVVLFFGFLLRFLERDSDA